jgi:hypothetical protein
MKYIITESKLNQVIFKYLNDIEWDVFDYTDWEYGNMTRLFYKGESQFPEEAIFESYDNEDCTDVSVEDDEECPTERVLLVNRGLYNTIESLFGLHFLQTQSILISWFENYTNEIIDDPTIGFID